MSLNTLLKVMSLNTLYVYLIREREGRRVITRNKLYYLNIFFV